MLYSLASISTVILLVQLTLADIGSHQFNCRRSNKIIYVSLKISLVICWIIITKFLCIFVWISYCNIYSNVIIIVFLTLYNISVCIHPNLFWNKTLKFQLLEINYYQTDIIPDLLIITKLVLSLLIDELYSKEKLH